MDQPGSRIWNSFPRQTQIGEWHRKPYSTAGVKLFVGGLPYVSTEAELLPLFQQFGTVLEFELQRTHTGVSKGCAWLRYSQYSEASEAIKAMHNKVRLGTVTRPVQLCLCEPPNKYHQQQQEQVISLVKSEPFSSATRVQHLAQHGSDLSNSQPLSLQNSLDYPNVSALLASAQASRSSSTNELGNLGLLGGVAGLSHTGGLASSAGNLGHGMSTLGGFGASPASIEAAYQMLLKDGLSGGGLEAIAPSLSALLNATGANLSRGANPGQAQQPGSAYPAQPEAHNPPAHVPPAAHVPPTTHVAPTAHVAPSAQIPTNLDGINLIEQLQSLLFGNNASGAGVGAGNTPSSNNSGQGVSNQNTNLGQTTNFGNQNASFANQNASFANQNTNTGNLSALQAKASSVSSIGLSQGSSSVTAEVSSSFGVGGELVHLSEGEGRSSLLGRISQAGGLHPLGGA